MAVGSEGRVLRGNEESVQRQRWGGQGRLKRLGEHLIGYLGGAIAVLVTSLALVHGTASAQAAPTLEPVPNQLANGASATTPGLAANTIEVALAWTGGEPGGEYPLRVTWGDGVVENLTVDTGPLVLEHTYPDTGAYAASARFVLPGSPVRAFDVTILDIPPEAEAMVVSPEMDAAQRFGQAIAFDGTRALVGSPREPGTSGGGRVHVFRR